MVPVNVFEYVDYRLFMKAFYEAKKKSPGTFSYRRFSKLAENASPNFVKLVVDGQRNLTVLNIHKFALAMGLSPIEHDFFVALVHFTQEEDGDCQNYYRARMLKIMREREREPLQTSASGETLVSRG